VSAPETDPELGLSDVVSEGDVVFLTSAVHGRTPTGELLEKPSLEARPVTCIDVVGDRVTALVTASADWVRDLSAESQVVATRDHGGRYVALSGTATTSDDRARIEGYWSRMADAWFDGPDDPDVRILDVEVDGGEWWHTPTSGIGTALAMVGTIVLGRPAATGSRGTVTTSSDAS
jgi:general stress protein 26